VSQLLGQPSGTDPLIDPNDPRLLRQADRSFVLACAAPAFIAQPSLQWYRSAFWPRRGGFVGDVSADIGVMDSGWTELPEITGGSRSRFGVIGVTRDRYNSPLGGVTLKLYRTQTDEMVDTIVSDPFGNYLLTTPYYPDAHYIVAYKAGSPDVQGTTVNTLIGA
jgi:hypothetical protein